MHHQTFTSNTSIFQLYPFLQNLTPFKTASGSSLCLNLNYTSEKKNWRWTEQQHFQMLQSTLIMKLDLQKKKKSSLGLTHCCSFPKIIKMLQILLHCGSRGVEIIHFELQSWGWVFCSAPNKTLKKFLQHVPALRGNNTRGIFNLKNGFWFTKWNGHFHTTNIKIKRETLKVQALVCDLSSKQKWSAHYSCSDNATLENLHTYFIRMLGRSLIVTSGNDSYFSKFIKELKHVSNTLDCHDNKCCKSLAAAK